MMVATRTVIPSREHWPARWSPPVPNAIAGLVPPAFRCSRLAATPTVSVGVAALFSSQGDFHERYYPSHARNRQCASDAGRDLSAHRRGGAGIAGTAGTHVRTSHLRGSADRRDRRGSGHLVDTCFRGSLGGRPPNTP